MVFVSEGGAVCAFANATQATAIANAKVNLKIACIEKGRRFTLRRRRPMILSKFFTIVFASALLAAPTLRADDVDLEKAVRSLIDAEIAYDKLANEKNFAAASIQVFADDGVAFAPGPVNGKKFWAKQTEPPILTWQPIFATVSRAADLGYTTGPWELRKTRNDPKPQGFGHYITLWRKNADGVWKAAVDVGVEHAKPTEPPGDVKIFVESLMPASVAFSDVSGSKQPALKKAQQTFIESLKRDAGAAIIAGANDDVRVYRNGASPAVGKMAAQGLLGSDHGRTARLRGGGGISRLGDLAYDYGEYLSEHNNVAERGIYFSIWRLDPGDEWKLALDLQKKSLK